MIVKLLLAAYSLKHARDLIRAISKKVKGPQYIYATHPALATQGTSYSLKSLPGTTAAPDANAALASRMSMRSGGTSRNLSRSAVRLLPALTHSVDA